MVKMSTGTNFIRAVLPIERYVTGPLNNSSVHLGTISTHESALAKLISLHVNVTGPYIFQVYLMEKAGRRPLLLYGMIGMGISAAVITIGLNVKVGKNGLHEPSLPGREAG